MPCRAAYWFLRTVALTAAIAAWLPAAAQAPERPALYRDFCASCHEAARPLIERATEPRDGTLYARRSGQPLADFLPSHVSDLTAAQAEIIAQALLQVAQGKGRFQESCGICHHSAANLAHYKLILVDGVLRGRYSDRDIAAFMVGHGTDSAAEASFFTQVLRRHTDAER